MRRFAAVFASRRDKQPPPPLVTDHAHSSASSSSGSASLYLHTPDDDQHHLEVVDRRSSSKKSWKSWLKGSPKPPQPTKHWQNPSPLPDWTSPHELDDTQSEPSIEDEQAPQDPRKTLEILVKNSLVPRPIPPSPFAHHSDAPLIFPKSVNLASSIHHSQYLASTVLKTRLLARLESDDRPLTAAEQASIASLASRRVSPLVPVNPAPHPFNESVPSRTTVISLSSPGLSRWISRPCFEERYAVFLAQEDGSISRRPVAGTSLAVAALEYSEALEAMVDFDLHDLPPPSSSLVIEIPSSVPESVSAPPSASGHTRNSPYIAVPSPLRNEHNQPAPPAVAVSRSAPPAVPAPSATTDPLVKRGVRFAEDDKDDVIPIGYVLRMKKRREEKAKFLQAEQQRRLLVEERMRMEAERRRRDTERAGWEAERRAWEEEKRAMDEERRQRKYTEEVIAARLRRESQRVGGVPALIASDNNGLLGSSGSAAGFFPSSVSSSASERNKAAPARRQTKAIYQDVPVHLPRREASEPNLPTITRTGPSTAAAPIAHSHSHGSTNSHSPGSSRPPSVKGTPPSIESSPSLSGTHSPAMYSSQASSSEDVKAAVAAAARRTKRNSFAASMSRNSSSGSLGGDRAASYPAWTASNQSLNVMLPPVPPVPMIPMQMHMMPVPAIVMMDTPLLPPTPPFMMQQYPRQNGSPRSSGSGTGSSKGRLPSSQNSSREKLKVVNGAGWSGLSSPSGHPPRSASFPRPEYRHASSTPTPPRNSSQHGHGTTSGDPRRASMPVSVGLQQNHSTRPRQHSDQRPPPPSHSHSQPSSMSQGTSSQHLQLPSPWTGIPTQNGALPQANTMPPRQHSQTSIHAGTSTKAKRQTTIS